MLSPRDDHLVAADVDLKFLQRARRRARDILSCQVVTPIVASTPNHLFVLAILNGAVEMRADGGIRAVFSSGSPDQNSRLAPEFEDFAFIGFQFRGFRGHNAG